MAPLTPSCALLFLQDKKNSLEAIMFSRLSLAAKGRIVEVSKARLAVWNPLHVLVQSGPQYRLFARWAVQLPLLFGGRFQCFQCFSSSTPYTLLFWACKQKSGTWERTKVSFRCLSLFQIFVLTLCSRWRWGLVSLRGHFILWNWGLEIFLSRFLCLVFLYVGGYF